MQKVIVVVLVLSSFWWNSGYPPTLCCSLVKLGRSTNRASKLVRNCRYMILLHALDRLLEACAMCNNTLKKGTAKENRINFIRRCCCKKMKVVTLEQQ
uniref:Putative secreted peptide n=1 Tax=Anopheles braziliensis TaxID=58242 RepID=A0A2M3ZR60_9DIPT